MKRPDLVLLIAVWEFFTAFLAFIGICAIAAFAFPPAIGSMWEYSMPSAVFFLSVSMLVLLCFIGISIAAGVGLLRGSEWGRVLGIIHSALSLFSFPAGTAIGVLCIVYLTKADVAAYFKSGGKTPTTQPENN
jgi:hypothetical protein